MNTRRSSRLSKDRATEAGDKVNTTTGMLSPATIRPKDDANAHLTGTSNSEKKATTPKASPSTKASASVAMVRRTPRGTTSNPVGNGPPNDTAASMLPSSSSSVPNPTRPTRSPPATQPSSMTSPASLGISNVKEETSAKSAAYPERKLDDTSGVWREARSVVKMATSENYIPVRRSPIEKGLPIESTSASNINDLGVVGALPPSPLQDMLKTPPASEVTFSTGGNKDRLSGDSSRFGSGPKYLDEMTLTLVKNYLTHSKGDELDEEDVVDMSIRLNRAANQRARYHTSIVAGKTHSQISGHLSDDASEVGSDDTSIYEECLEEEEEHSMGHELLKKLVATLEHQKSAASSLGEFSSASAVASRTSLTNGNILLDKKTMTWIKRAVGLHRSDTRNIIKNHDVKSIRSRFTRRQAQQNRHKKRERGLDILGDALVAMEVAYGPFPVKVTRKVGREKKKSRRAKEADAEEKHAADRRQKRKYERLTSDVDEAKRRKKEKEKTKREDKSKKNMRPPRHKLMLNTVTKPPVRKKEKVTSVPQKICTSLRMLDWMWRDRTKQYRNLSEPIETPATYRARRIVALHPRLKAAGVVHRLPRMNAFGRQHEKPNDTPARVYDPPRHRHTDQQYAELCSQLMNCLQGHARLFVTCEFFYSDLDREWYNFNSFAADVFKLGVPRNARLTMKEWKAVRRLIHRKPRLFSRHFIASQRDLRNAYRSNVRLLQNNPHLATKATLPYNVYFPIRVGSMVTAYSKLFRIIQRGRVLTYDRSTALYLIEFENKHFGFELCPDSDVATCGPPDVMVRSAQNTVIGNPVTNGLEMPFLGSGTGPISGLSHLPSLKVGAMLDQLLVFSPTCKGRQQENDDRNRRAQLVRPKPLLEDVANHSAFEILMEILDKARNRKWDFLTLIEDATTLALKRTNGGGSHVPMSSEMRDHMRWLRSNLGKTDSILRTAMDYLRTLYGDAFLRSNQLRVKSDDRGRRYDFIEEISGVEGNNTIRSPLSHDWTVNLVAQTQDIAESISSRIMTPSQTMRPASIQLGNATVDLKDRVTSTAQLFCTLAYIMNVADTPLATEADTALAVVSEKLIVDTFPRDGGASRSHHDLYDDVLDARDAAVTDLNEALDLLKAELALCKVKQSLVRNK